MHTCSTRSMSKPSRQFFFVEKGLFFFYSLPTKRHTIHRSKICFPLYCPPPKSSDFIYTSVPIPSVEHHGRLQRARDPYRCPRARWMPPPNGWETGGGEEVCPRTGGFMNGKVSKRFSRFLNAGRKEGRGTKIICPKGKWYPDVVASLPCPATAPR